MQSSIQFWPFTSYKLQVNYTHLQNVKPPFITISIVRKVSPGTVPSSVAQLPGAGAISPWLGARCSLRWPCWMVAACHASGWGFFGVSADGRPVGCVVPELGCQLVLIYDLYWFIADVHLAEFVPIHMIYLVWYYLICRFAFLLSTNSLSIPLAFVVSYCWLGESPCCFGLVPTCFDVPIPKLYDIAPNGFHEGHACSFVLHQNWPD